MNPFKKGISIGFIIALVLSGLGIVGIFIPALGFLSLIFIIILPIGMFLCGGGDINVGQKGLISCTPIEGFFLMVLSVVIICIFFGLISGLAFVLIEKLKKN